MFSYSNLILSKKFLDYKLNFINYKLFWSTFRATKIVLQGESTAHLFDIEELAKKAHIPHYLVHDAGKTQVCNLFCSIPPTECLKHVTSLISVWWRQSLHYLLMAVELFSFTGVIWCIDCDWFVWFIVRSGNAHRVIITVIEYMTVCILYFRIGLTEVKL